MQRYLSIGILEEAYIICVHMLVQFSIPLKDITDTCICDFTIETYVMCTDKQIINTACVPEYDIINSQGRR